MGTAYGIFPRRCVAHAWATSRHSAGFVGTGGGMMMLVVFTAFLGMELKTAVGTSTFIITFTALIASAAHMVIHPAIVLEKWDVMLLEKEPWFDKLLVQKKPGEIKQSLLLLFAMIAADIAAAWGLFGKQYVAVASVLMWGFGDAAAALVGIPFGKHIVPWKISDGKKTFEGTCAMFVVSALVGCAVLILLSGTPVWQCVLAALLCGVAGALTELGSKNGMDTVTVPAVLVALLLLLGV